MKSQRILIGSFLALTLITARAEDKKEDTPLEKHMSAMNQAFKAFREEKDPVKGAAKAREAQVAALKSAMEVPKTLSTLPDSPEKTKALLEFHKMVGKLYLTFCEVEGAFIEGKLDEVATIVASLKDQKKSGHEKFIKEDE